MKLNIFKSILVSIILTCVFVSCGNKENIQDMKVEGTLHDTKWKLLGMVKVSTDKMEKRYPESLYYYTLLFYDDSTFTGRSSGNELIGSYNVNYKTRTIRIVHIGGTELMETIEGELYRNTLYAVRYFSLQENELRLYYNKNKNYLLYKKLQEL